MSIIIMTSWKRSFPWNVYLQFLTKYTVFQEGRCCRSASWQVNQSRRAYFSAFLVKLAVNFVVLCQVKHAALSRTAGLLNTADRGGYKFITPAVWPQVCPAVTRWRWLRVSWSWHICSWAVRGHKWSHLFPPKRHVLPLIQTDSAGDRRRH